MYFFSENRTFSPFLAQLLCSRFETTLEINDIAKEIVFFGLSQKNIFVIKVRGEGVIVRSEKSSPLSFS